MKIGIFGGTFDPIHFGHINLAIEMLEKEPLDQIWFCPARVNPHRLEVSPVASIEHRIRMLELAIEDIPGCMVLDLEIKREGPSYTIDTIEELIRCEKNVPTQNSKQFYLILGDDAIPGFFRWHRVERLVELVTLLIGNRQIIGKEITSEQSPQVWAAIQKGIRKATPFWEISSTSIRHRLQRGLYCGHLVPAKVIDYIYTHKLYSSP